MVKVCRKAGTQLNHLDQPFEHCSWPQGSRECGTSSKAHGVCAFGTQAAGLGGGGCEAQWHLPSTSGRFVLGCLGCTTEDVAPCGSPFPLFPIALG